MATCEWMIAPHGASGIVLSFDELSTQPGVDIICLYQCMDISCSQEQKLAELSGLYDTPQAVISDTGYMKVVFTSDGSINYDGFKASWISVSKYKRIACNTYWNVGTAICSLSSKSLEVH
jgi:hypothetical protein